MMQLLFINNKIVNTKCYFVFTIICETKNNLMTKCFVFKWKSSEKWEKKRKKKKKKKNKKKKKVVNIDLKVNRCYVYMYFVRDRERVRESE